MEHPIFYNSTSHIAAIVNSFMGTTDDFMIEPEPAVPAAETPPPRRRETRRERRERRARQAAEKKKAGLCHAIFCRLPR